MIFLIKVTDTLESVIANGKHALNNLPKKAKPGDIMLVAQSKPYLKENGKSIRYIMYYDGFYEDKKGECKKLWGREWKYIIKGKDVQSVKPFNISDVQLSSKNYQQASPLVYLPPEDEKAVRHYIFSQNNEAVYPDELPGCSAEYNEGKKKLVQINTYERNPEARRKCIDKYGAVCCICEFNFGKMYGAEFDGKIHVHHMKMISESDGEYVVNPINDLRPVCPNCHMVLHCKKDGCYTIEEVKTMLAVEKMNKGSNQTKLL